MYRLAQEGLHLLLPHITRQVVHLSVRDMLRLLTERYVALPAVPPEVIASLIQPSSLLFKTAHQS